MPGLRTQNCTVDPVSQLFFLLKTHKTFMMQERCKILDHFNISIQIDSAFCIKRVQPDVVR